MKKPWLAALLNFLFYGVGYLYVGKRVLFGILLIVAGVFESIFWLSTDSMPPTIIITSLIASAVFAYDGYRDAQQAE